MKRGAMVLIGAVAVAALLASRSVVASVKPPAPGSNPGPAPEPSDPCQYDAGLPAPLGQSQMNVYVNRIRERIREVNPGLSAQRLGAFAADHWLALCIVEVCNREAMPFEIVVAVMRRESSFNLYVDRVASSLAQGECTFASQTEIGPMQTKPGVFCDVGMDSSELLTTNMAARVNLAVTAGVKYLARCRNHYRKGENWCEALYCYTEGPTGSRLDTNRARKAGYVADIMRWARTYSELRR
jgi:hypothetical protein